MAIYSDTEVFCLSITGRENFQYRPLLASICRYLSGYSGLTHKLLIWEILSGLYREVEFLYRWPLANT